VSSCSFAFVALAVATLVSCVDPGYTPLFLVSALDSPVHSAAYSDTGLVGSTPSQQTAPIRKSTPVR
jgi:hypothetical protein